MLHARQKPSGRSVARDKRCWSQWELYVVTYLSSLAKRRHLIKNEVGGHDARALCHSWRRQKYSFVCSNKSLLTRERYSSTGRTKNEFQKIKWFRWRSCRKDWQGTPGLGRSGISALWPFVVSTHSAVIVGRKIFFIDLFSFVRSFRSYIGLSVKQIRIQSWRM